MRKYLNTIELKSQSYYQLGKIQMYLNNIEYNTKNYRVAILLPARKNSNMFSSWIKGLKKVKLSQSYYQLGKIQIPPPTPLNEVRTLKMVAILLPARKNSNLHNREHLNMY